MMRSWRTAAGEPARLRGSEPPTWRGVSASHSTDFILQGPFIPSSTSSRLLSLSSRRIPMFFPVRMVPPVLILTIVLS